MIQILRISPQVFFRNELGIRAQCGVPQAAFTAHVVDGDHSVGDRIVLESLGLADHQNVLEMNLLFMRRWRQRWINRRLILTCSDGC